MRALVLNRGIPKGLRPDPLVQVGVGGWDKSSHRPSDTPFKRPIISTILFETEPTAQRLFSCCSLMIRLPLIDLHRPVNLLQQHYPKQPVRKGQFRKTQIQFSHFQQFLIQT